MLVAIAIALAAPPFAVGDAGGRRDGARCWSALIDSDELATLGRLAELSRPGSSGYDRLVLPLASFYRLVGDPGGWLAGHGAGQITTDFGNAWPMVKLTYEYGLPTAVAWLALFVAPRSGAGAGWASGSRSSSSSSSPAAICSARSWCSSSR